MREADRTRLSELFVGVSAGCCIEGFDDDGGGAGRVLTGAGEATGAAAGAGASTVESPASSFFAPRGLRVGGLRA